MFQQIWASRGGNEHGMRFASTGTMHDEMKLAYNCIYVSIELHLYLEICVMYIPSRPLRTRLQSVVAEGENVQRSERVEILDSGDPVVAQGKIGEAGQIVQILDLFDVVERQIQPL